MTSTQVIPVHERIKEAMDGRPNTWLKGKLSEKGIELSDSMLSQRMNGKADFTGEETIACFDILNIPIKPE